MSHRKSFFTNRILMSILSLFFIFGSVEPTLAERVDSGVPGMLFEHNVPVTMTDGHAPRQSGQQGRRGLRAGRRRPRTDT